MTQIRPKEVLFTDRLFPLICQYKPIHSEFPDPVLLLLYSCAPLRCSTCTCGSMEQSYRPTQLQLNDCQSGRLRLVWKSSGQLFSSASFWGPHSLVFGSSAGGVWGPDPAVFGSSAGDFLGVQPAVPRVIRGPIL